MRLGLDDGVDRVDPGVELRNVPSSSSEEGLLWACGCGEGGIDGVGLNYLGFDVGHDRIRLKRLGLSRVALKCASVWVGFFFFLDRCWVPTLYSYRLRPRPQLSSCLHFSEGVPRLNCGAGVAV